MKIKLYKNYYRAPRINAPTKIVYSYYSDFQSLGHDIITVEIPDRLKPYNYAPEMIAVQTKEYTYDICEYLTAYGENGIKVEVEK